MIKIRFNITDRLEAKEQYSRIVKHVVIPLIGEDVRLPDKGIYRVKRVIHTPLDKKQNVIVEVR